MLVEYLGESVERLRLLDCFLALFEVVDYDVESFESGQVIGIVGGTAQLVLASRFGSVIEMWASRGERMEKEVV